MIYLKTLLAEAKLKLSIPSDIKKLYKLFKKNRKQLYVVGGAVRDAILGKSPKDFDLATDAKPDEVLKIAKQGGLKTYEVGKAFGVVVVGGHEIATFRKDIGRGRRPTAVDFSDIKGDVNRRDLTINSLFYDIGTNQVVDLTGGLKDLKAKIAIGNSVHPKIIFLHFFFIKYFSALSFKLTWNHNFFKSLSVISTFFALDSPHLLARRWIWVSTGNAGISYHCDITTLAVLWPTPAKLSRNTQSALNPPGSIICCAIFFRFFAFVGANPIS